MHFLVMVLLGVIIGFSIAYFKDKFKDHNDL